MVRASVVLFLLLPLTTATRAFAADDDVVGVVKSFYTAFAGSDTERMRSLWAPAKIRDFENSYARFSFVRCMVLHRVVVDDVRIDGDSASAGVHADLTSWSRHPRDLGRIETIWAIAQLVRQDGRWRITALKLSESDVAKAIIGGAAWRDVVPPAVENGSRIRNVVRELTREAVNRVNQSRGDEGKPLAAIALEIAAEYGDTDALSEAYGAMTFFDRDDPRRIMQWANRSVALAEKRGNPDIVARALQRLANANALDNVHSREPYERILAMADSIESVLTVANASVGLSAHYTDVGDSRNALLQSLDAVKWGTVIGDRGTLFSASYNLGYTYLWQGDAEMAIPYCERSVELSRATGLVSVLPDSLVLLAQALWDANRRDQARATMDEAVAEAERLHQSVAEAHLSRTGFLLASYELDCAAAELRMVLGAAKGLRAYDLALAWDTLAAVELAQGRPREALASARVASQLSDGSPDSFGRVQAGRALRVLGRLDDAAAELLVKVSHSDEARARAVPEARQLWMFARSRAADYAELADVLVEAGKPQEAIEVVRKVRGRVLRDLRDGGGERPLTRDEQKNRERLERRIEELNSVLLRGGESVELRAELAKARLEMDELHARLSVDRKIAEVQARPESAVNRDVAVVEYVVAPARLLAFVRAAGGNGATRLHAIPIAVTPAALQTAVDELVASIEQRDFRFARRARSLYDLLIRPLEPFIGPSRSVCIIPDGELWRLPFHALRVANGQYLGDRYALFYAPSIDFLAKRNGESHQPRFDLLAFANATADGDAVTRVRALYRNTPLGALPDAEVEARRVAGLYGAARSRLYVGSAAREAVFKRDAAASRIVHVATHGILDNQSPMYSALILSAGKNDGEDGLLEAREIAALHLQTDIAVLSACDTARGKVAAGEGVMGIAWAFLIAGCPTTVVSLWKADSAATAELMVAFHKHLRAGAAPADALRSAQRELRRNPRYRDPLYWAPFIVLGADQ